MQAFLREEAKPTITNRPRCGQKGVNQLVVTHTKREYHDSSFDSYAVSQFSM